MSRSEIQTLAGALGLLVLAALWPLIVGPYYLTLSITAMQFAALAVSWALFSGPTRYISLATSAFFGLGAFVFATGIEQYQANFVLMLLISALSGGMIAFLIGLATLRLSGVYFVIFTLGLAEMIRNLISWLQANFLNTNIILAFVDLPFGWFDHILYWMLLGATALVLLIGWLIGRSRLGFAMRIIGDDELVARHVGVNVPLSKVVLFTISGVFAAFVGAAMVIQAGSVEPNNVFKPEVSFYVVIMALLGGINRLWGPLLGVLAFTIIDLLIKAYAPGASTIVLGVAFLVIVFFIPTGIVGLAERYLGGKRT